MKNSKLQRPNPCQDVKWAKFEKGHQVKAETEKNLKMDQATLAVMYIA